MQIHQQSLKKNDIQCDFDAVCEVIEKRVLEEQQCLSMESVVSVYSINEGDRQQRYRLKTSLLVMIFCLFPMRNTLLSL